jgi:manganese transport system ATP-binding protein
MRMNPAVTATDLELGYGTEVVLARSSFTIPAETITAVIGPNGSGKSTLLNAIAGLLEPISGTLEVPARRRGSYRIAYVLQTTRVHDALPITVREVVAMGRFPDQGVRRFDAEDREAIDGAMQRTGITDISGRHLSELSGGERQRVFVAQGLAQDHDVLLLDEPLTGIDLVAARSIDDVIHAERDGGRTVILTTHDLSEARVADHVLLLAGRVVAAGPPAEVLTDDHLLAAYGPSLLHVQPGGVIVDDPAHPEAHG